MKKKAFLILVGLFVGVAIGVILTPVISQDNFYNQIEKYQFVFGTAVKNYVDDVDSQRLTEAAIEGMLNELDPHSVYISAEKMKAVEEDFQGSFDGIGVQFDIINDTITVISPIAGGPSESLGIMSGDKIIMIDGEEAVGMDRDEVPKKLRGPKGTIVKVDIKRGTNPKLINFEIVRDKIPLYSVDASFIVDETDIGVVVVNRFSATTHQEMVEALRKLKSQGMKRLILDLRNNPGGYLNQAHLMANEFLKRGDTIVYTKGRRPQFDEVMRANGSGEFIDLPIIVMINHGSASASEIVSGAVQDLDRGLVVGTTSFGKGLVQRQFPIGDGSAFRLTISRYYTPSGRSIQRPYEDKVQYRRLFGRLELEEGSNIEHSLEAIKNNNADGNIDFDSIPLYYTRSGRTVIGGGGITPDYVVKSDTLTDFSVQLRRNRIVNEFVTNSMKNGEDVRKKYENNFRSFLKSFNLTDAEFAEFRKLVESKDIEWNQEEFERDKTFIMTDIKSTLSRIIWDRDRNMQVFYDIDRQFQTALTLFPEAEKISRLK